MSIQPPIPVQSPTELFAAVNSASITPSNTLNLQAVKATGDGNGIHLEALATGTGGNAVTLAIELPDNEAAGIVVDVTGSDTVVTLAASGTRAMLDAQGILFQSIVKGTDANDITVEYADPATVSATASVDVTGTAIKVNLATDAGSKSTLTNQDIVYTAVEKGSGGDNITIALVKPVTPNQPLGVVVVGDAISVNLATGPGTAQVETATAAGTVASDVAQVETATAAGTVAASGNATVTVTAAGMTNSPKDISVAVLELDEAGDIATKIRSALTADVDVAAFFAVSGATDQIVLTRLAAAANDATMNIAIADGTSVGVTSAPTSANTTAGLIGGGNASVVVTGAGITGSPLTVPVAVSSGDTPTMWAAKVRAALDATAAISDVYDVSGTGTSIILTKIIPLANDATLNIAIATGTATGITTAATSANTTAGVAGAITSTRQQVALAVANNTNANDLVTVTDPGTPTVVTAVAATNLAGGGSAPFATTTTRQQALALLLAESEVTDLVTVSVNDVNHLRALTDMGATNLAGGGVSSISTVQAVVNALNADGDFDGLAVASALSLSHGSNIAQPTSDPIELSGGDAGQWSLDSNFTRAISANTDGNIAYIPFNGSTAVTVAVKAGVMYPIVARRVNSTNTTATGIVGHI